MIPPTKKRKKSAVEEITFDSSAREEYLTGFHKRKVQRIKHAQEEAAKKERQERVIGRKKMREERKADLEKHVETVNAMLREANDTVPGFEDGQSGSDVEEWTGLSELPDIDHEAEYVDEDRYTTVTVEAVNISKEGIHKVVETEQTDGTAQRDDNKHAVTNGAGREGDDKAQKGKRRWTKDNPDGHVKKKKKKFRYESKADRKVTRYKERSGNKSKARARKE